MGKPPKKLIPLSKIPEGVRLCHQNCTRLLKDAKLLIGKKRYHTAISNVILAKEEFAKILLLLNHYKKDEDVPASKAEEYFSKHRVRLEEFREFYHDDFPQVLGGGKKWRQHWLFDEMEKERQIYVDWTGMWQSPITLFGKASIVNPKKMFELMANSQKNELDKVLNQIKRNPYFVEAMGIKDNIVPTRPKLQKIIDKIAGQPVSIKFDLNDKELKLEIQKHGLQNHALVGWKALQTIGRMNYPYRNMISWEK